MNLPADRGPVATIFEHRDNGVVTFTSTPPSYTRVTPRKLTFAGLIRLASLYKREGWYIKLEEPLFGQEVPA